MTAQREQEAVRRLIGLTLVALLIFMVVSAVLVTEGRHHPDPALLAAVKTKADAERLAAVLKLSSEAAKEDAEQLSTLLNIVFGPVVALIGSVTGFYFGRSRNKP